MALVGTSRAPGLWLCWVALIVLTWAGITPPPARAACDGVSGRALDAASGQPLAGVTVSLLAETKKTGAEGAFCFERVPRKRRVEFSLSVRDRRGLVTACEVFHVPVRFAALAASDGDRVDVQVVEPGVEGPVELRLRRVAPQEVDRYCVECHRWNPCLESEGVVSLVESRKYLRGIIVTEEEVEEARREFERKAIQRDTYRKIRYTDTHALPVDMGRFAGKVTEDGERYRRPPRLKLLPNGTTTCDTCHTRHLPTEPGAYVVLPYREHDELCLQCHRR